MIWTISKYELFRVYLLSHKIVAVEKVFMVYQYNSHISSRHHGQQNALHQNRQPQEHSNCQHTETASQCYVQRDRAGEVVGTAPEISSQVSRRRAYGIHRYIVSQVRADVYFVTSYLELGKLLLLIQ